MGFTSKSIFANCGWLVCLTAFFIILQGCKRGNGSIDIREYYFPLQSLKQPMVYEYRAVNNDTSGAEYWYFRTHETDTAMYFTGNYFSRDLRVEQFSSEEVVRNGTIQKDYVLFMYDSLGQKYEIPGEIEYGNTFPFEVKDSNSVFLQKLKWTFSETPLITTTLIRNRRYKGKTNFTYKGKEYECVEFQLKELIDDFNNGHFEKEYGGKELYARGLGLVYYKKVIDHITLEYELADVYPMEKLQQKLKTNLNE